MAESQFDEWRAEAGTGDTQAANEQWWNEHPMAYDWDASLGLQEGSAEYFAAIDRRFFSANEHSAHPGWPAVLPFSALEDFSKLTGKDVLEIGCGMGGVAQVLAQSGSRLTAIDLTEKGVEMTRRRLQLAGLSARILKMDAEAMAFSDNSFDFIWSWGVIHHSAHTEKIVAEMLRVLRPGGRFAVMVYHRHSTRYWISGLLRRGVLGLELLRKTPQQIQMSFTDGFLARHYSRRELRALFQQFRIEEIRAVHMDDGSIPFRPLRQLLRRGLGERRYWDLVRVVESRVGWMLFIKGSKPA